MSRAGIPATFPGVPAGVNGRPELRPRPYRWRDPQRVSPERLAELAARDARLIALEAMCAGQRTAKAGRCQPATAEQKAAYRAARDLGMAVYKAAAAAGVSPKTASKWEKQRREASHG